MPYSKRQVQAYRLLTPKARAALAQIEEHPVPRQNVTRAILLRLEAGKYIANLLMLSPFIGHRPGRKIKFVRITKAGVAALRSAQLFETQTQPHRQARILQRTRKNEQ